MQLRWQTDAIRPYAERLRWAKLERAWPLDTIRGSPVCRRSFIAVGWDPDALSIEIRSTNGRGADLSVGGSGVWTCHILQADRTVASRRPYYVAWSLVWTRTVGTLTCVNELVLLALPSAFVLPPPVQTTRFHVYCPRSLSQAFGSPIPSCWVYPAHEYPAVCILLAVRPWPPSSWLSAGDRVESKHIPAHLGGGH